MKFIKTMDCYIRKDFIFEIGITVDDKPCSRDYIYTVVINDKYHVKQFNTREEAENFLDNFVDQLNQEN